MTSRGGAAGVILLSVVVSAEAASWRLGRQTQIAQYGVCASVWSGTAAYTIAAGGPVMFYNGTTSVQIYPGTACNYEPTTAAGLVAWRNWAAGATADDILLWNGQTVVNLTNSPAVDDSYLSLGSNGDLIWSRNLTDLTYRCAASGTTVPLGVRGRQACLYIAPGNVPTYAYQDSDTFDVKYYDGAGTHVVGPGNHVGAYPSLWNGAIAWIGTGQGTDTAGYEVFFWKAGQTQRITNDDAVNGIADLNPRVWNDLVLWARCPTGLMNPKLFLWDGTATAQLTTASAKYPSLHDGWVGYADTEWLYLARLFRRGDMNCDYAVDAGDIAPFHLAVTDPNAYAAAYADCERNNADVNGDGAINATDISLFWALLGATDCNANWVADDQDLEQCAGSPWCGDCNGNGLLDVCDIAGGHSQDCNGNGVPDECELAGHDCNGNGVPDTCELAGHDCNGNGILDVCDIAGGQSQDCNGNGVPDECELAGHDCNANGILDECDIANGTSQDANSNGVPDECEAPPLCAGDMNCDGRVTFGDIDLFVQALSGESAWPHTCPWLNADCNHDGRVTFGDIDPFVARIGTTCP